MAKEELSNVKDRKRDFDEGKAFHEHQITSLMDALRLVDEAEKEVDVKGKKAKELEVRDAGALELGSIWLQALDAYSGEPVANTEVEIWPSEFPTLEEPSEEDLLSSALSHNYTGRGMNTNE